MQLVDVQSSNLPLGHKHLPSISDLSPLQAVQAPEELHDVQADVHAPLSAIYVA